MLRQVRNLSGKLSWRRTEQRYIAMHWINEPGQGFEQGGLTGTIRANEHEKFAWLHVERNVVDNRTFAVTNCKGRCVNGSH